MLSPCERRRQFREALPDISQRVTALIMKTGRNRGRVGQIKAAKASAQVGRFLARFERTLDGVPLFGHVVDSESLANAREYLIIAREDLKLSRHLLDESWFASAVYYMQQAVEKTATSFALAIGVITHDSLPKRHMTPDRILRALKEEAGRDLIALARTITGNAYEKHLASANHLVNSKPDVIRQWSGETISALLDLLDKFERSATDESLVAPMEAAVKRIFHDCLPGWGPEIEERLDPTPFVGALVGTSTHVLGAITFPHENSTRYPSYSLRPHNYTADLPIVTALARLGLATEVMLGRQSAVLDAVEVHTTGDAT